MRRSSTAIVLSALSMGVLGGVVPKPYEMNSTTIVGAPRPHTHATGLPIPPSALSTLRPEPSAAIIVPYPIQSSSNASVVAASPSLSTAYAVSSSSPEVSPVTLSVSSSFNVTAQNQTFVYSPLSSSVTITSPSSVPTSEYPPVVVVVVAETVYYTVQPSSSVASNATLPTVSTSDCSTTLPASATQSSSAGVTLNAESAVTPSAAPSSGVVTSILPGTPMAALGKADELAGSTIDLGLLSSILLSDIIQRSIATTTITTTTTVVLTLSTPLLPSPSDIDSSASTTTTTTVVALPTASSFTSAASPTSTLTSDSVVPSSSAADSASTILSTVTVTSSAPSSAADSASTVLSTVTVTSSTPSSLSNTEFPTAPPFSFNPSASRGSASPISRPTPEASSAIVVGSTLSTTATPTSTANSQYTGIPPAPSAAGASSALSERNKERVWWVAFFVPFLLMA